MRDVHEMRESEMNGRRGRSASSCSLLFDSARTLSFATTHLWMDTLNDMDGSRTRATAPPTTLANARSARPLQRSQECFLKKNNFGGAWLDYEAEM